MKRTFVFALLVVAVMGLTACSPQKVSFDTLEQARGQARDNAMWNAEFWRANSSGVHASAEIIGRGDSTQSPECPQGDGWATMDMFTDKKLSLQLKCSTVSKNIGCLEVKDFKTKPYATEDGKCQSTDKVPFPLPKVGGK